MFTRLSGPDDHLESSPAVLARRASSKVHSPFWPGGPARKLTRLSGPEDHLESSLAFLARRASPKVHPPFWPGGPSRKFTRLSGPEGQPEISRGRKPPVSAGRGHAPEGRWNSSADLPLTISRHTPAQLFPCPISKERSAKSFPSPATRKAPARLQDSYPPVEVTPTIPSR